MALVLLKQFSIIYVLLGKEKMVILGKKLHISCGISITEQL